MMRDAWHACTMYVWRLPTTYLALFLRCQRVSHYDDMITHFLCKSRRRHTCCLPYTLPVPARCPLSKYSVKPQRPAKEGIKPNAFLPALHYISPYHPISKYKTIFNVVSLDPLLVFHWPFIIDFFPSSFWEIDNSEPFSSLRYSCSSCANFLKTVYQRINFKMAF